MKRLNDEKILFTGLTGQIGFPLALHLAKENEAWGLDIFRDEEKKKQLEQAGVKTRTLDLARPDYQNMPDDFSYLIHFAVYQEGGLDFDEALRVNAEGSWPTMTSSKPNGLWSRSITRFLQGRLP